MAQCSTWAPHFWPPKNVVRQTSRVYLFVCAPTPPLPRAALAVRGGGGVVEVRGGRRQIRVPPQGTWFPGCASGASTPVLISRHHTSSTSFLPLRAASSASSASASSSASAATAASVPLLPLPRTAGTACRRPLSCIRRLLPSQLPVLVEGPGGCSAPLLLRLLCFSIIPIPIIRDDAR